MSETGVAPRFSIGSVLSVSIGVLIANFLPFLMLGLIVLAPIYLYAYYWPTLHPDMPPPGMTALIGFLEYLATLVLSASLIYGTVQELRGRRASMLACCASSRAWSGLAGSARMAREPARSRPMSTGPLARHPRGREATTDLRRSGPPREAVPPPWGQARPADPPSRRHGAARAGIRRRP